MGKNHNKCCDECDPNAINDLKSKLDQLSQAVGILNKNAKFLDGHPIMLLENADDIDLFNLATGKGSGIWDIFAVCDGKTHYSNSHKKNITTPNFIDRFIIQGTGSYPIDSIGGQATVQLTEPQLAPHKHLISDPGHSHTITDPGHNHTVNDPGHNHTQNPHNHVFDAFNGSLGSALFAAAAGAESIGNTDTLTDNATATNNANTTGISLNSNTTGVEVILNQTGITETINTGEASPHENRPPYFSALYVMRIG